MNPQRPGELPYTFTWPGTDFSKIPPVWRSSNIPTQAIIVQREIAPASRLGDAKIDPGIVVHPRKSNLGVQPQGTMVAQNEYPGLQFLPIDVATAELEPIPIAWANLKLQSIPIEWPKAKALPVLSPTPASRSNSPQ